jgi:hypothetical protein
MLHEQIDPTCLEFHVDEGAVDVQLTSDDPIAFRMRWSGTLWTRRIAAST